jgi:predicted phage terminase large subunit-like protein
MDGRFKGAIVIDDPHKADEATSDVMRQNTIDWFQTTLESRKNSPDTPIILIMQRLHENDLAGWLMNGGNGEKWECVKIPAIDDDGDSFWPEQFPLDMLRRLEAANPYIFAGQYMQNPAPKTGGVFDAHKIEIIDALPAGVAGKVRGWDLAATAKGGDWTAGVLLDVSGGFTYIVDIQRIRGSAHDVEQLLVSTAKQDGAGIEQSIPQDPGQAGKAQAAYLSKRLTGANFKFSVESGDKATRASPFSAQVNAGNVKMLKAPWNNDILHELRSFPFGSHDDMIDGCSRAFNRIDKPRGGFMFGRA